MIAFCQYDFCNLQPPPPPPHQMWALMLPECFSCLTIAERERERGRECSEWERWGQGEEGGREKVCVCLSERGRGTEREREMCVCVCVCVACVCVCFSIVIIT